jgi:hypothetical protein
VTIEQNHPESAWRKSSHSDVDGNGACVEVALAVDAIGVRDSKAPLTGSLTFPSAVWAHFLAGFPVRS